MVLKGLLLFGHLSSPEEVFKRSFKRYYSTDIQALTEIRSISLQSQNGRWCERKD